MNESPRPITILLLDLKASFSGPDVSLGTLLQGFHERGFGFLLFVFALPAAIPLPGLGINIIIALPLLFLTVQQALGRHTLWMPARMMNKSLSYQSFCAIIDSALPYLRALERFVRPRMAFVTQGVFSHVIGLAGLIMTLSICIPLPLTNTIPAMGIALMALGVIMRDGLAVIAGMMLGLAWVALLGYVLIFIGTEGLDLIKETIKSFF